jgi:hypothetical protein
MDGTDQLRQKSWWGRNWKWFVPLMCLGALAALAAFAALILTLIFGLTKSSDAYKLALARVENSSGVRAALGTPIEAGLFTSGSVSLSGPSGAAELAIPISGPKGRGTVFVAASKSAGRWSFNRLLVEIERTGERINLLEGNPGNNNDVPVPAGGIVI